MLIVTMSRAQNEPTSRSFGFSCVHTWPLLRAPGLSTFALLFYKAGASWSIFFLWRSRSGSLIFNNPTMRHHCKHKDIGSTADKIS